MLTLKVPTQHLPSQPTFQAHDVVRRDGAPDGHGWFAWWLRFRRLRQRQQRLMHSDYQRRHVGRRDVVPAHIVADDLGNEWLNGGRCCGIGHYLSPLRLCFCHLTVTEGWEKLALNSVDKQAGFRLDFYTFVGLVIAALFVALIVIVAYLNPGHLDIRRTFPQEPMFGLDFDILIALVVAVVIAAILVWIIVPRKPPL